MAAFVQLMHRRIRTLEVIGLRKGCGRLVNFLETGKRILKPVALGEFVVHTFVSQTMASSAVNHVSSSYLNLERGGIRDRHSDRGELHLNFLVFLAVYFRSVASRTL